MLAGAGTEAELIPTLQALGGRCGAVVRVEGNARPRFQRALERGFRFVTVGSDSFFLAEAARAAAP